MTRKKKSDMKRLKDCNDGDLIKLGDTDYFIDDQGRLIKLTARIYPETFPISDLLKVSRQLDERKMTVSELIKIYNKKVGEKN